jgi:hypothetical protein
LMSVWKKKKGYPTARPLECSADCHWQLWSTRIIGRMSINLVTPFAEKSAVKALGRPLGCVQIPTYPVNP